MNGMEMSQMSVTSRQVKQTFQKTTGCYFHNEKFPMISMETITESFIFFAYSEHRIFCSKQRNNARITLLCHSVMLTLDK